MRLLANASIPRLSLTHIYEYTYTRFREGCSLSRKLAKGAGGLPTGRSSAGGVRVVPGDGLHPTDFKPLTTVGVGALEIRLRDASGEYRVIYVAKFPEVVFVLHAFQKRTQKTSMLDLELAAQRYRRLGRRP